MSIPPFDGGATRVGPGNNPLGKGLEELIMRVARQLQGRDPQRLAALLGGAGGSRTVVKGSSSKAEAPAPDRPAVPVAAAPAEVVEERGGVVV